MTEPATVRALTYGRFRCRPDEERFHDRNVGEHDFDLAADWGLRLLVGVFCEVGGRWWSRARRRPLAASTGRSPRPASTCTSRGRWAEITRRATTTVANWRKYGSTVCDGVAYGQRAHSFRALFHLSGATHVAQDTGFGQRLPIGDGLVAFSTPEEAVEALDEVDADYARHAAAARRIATDELDSAAVLGGLLRYAGVCGG